MSVSLAGGCGFAADHAPARRLSLPELRRAWTSSFVSARPLAGRLAGIGYAPLGPGVELAEETRRLAHTVRSSRRGSTPPISAEDHHVEALLELGFGGIDRAVAELLAATTQAPERAEGWSDLAAIYLRRSERNEEPLDLIFGLAAAEHGLALDRGLVAALFNRSLALERLFLREEAIAAWWAYLRRDPGSRWAEEAQQHLETLERPVAADDLGSQAQRLSGAATAEPCLLGRLVARFPQAARDVVHEALLPAWGRATLAGRPQDAERLLSKASAIAAALAAANRDRTEVDAIAVIERARGSANGGAVLRRLARGHALYAEGLASYQHDDFDRAAVLLGEAERLLREAASPFASWPALHRARCDYQYARYQSALPALASLVEDARRKGYFALTGRALRVIGLVHMHSGKPVEALAAFSQARALFARLGENGNLAAIDSLAAEAYEFLGERGDQWRSLFRALRESHEAGALVPSNNVLEDAALAAAQEGALSAALDFQHQFVREVRRAGHPLWVVEALSARAVLRSAAGEGRLALADIARARDALAQVPDPRSRRATLGDLWLAEGRIWRALDPSRAIRPLEQSLAVYRDTSRGHWSEVLLELALAHLALRRDDRAEQELMAAAAERERLREGIQGERERASYFGQMHEVVDQLVLIEAEQRGRGDIAFDYAERNRGRMLLDFTLDPAPAGAHPGAKIAAVAQPLSTRQVAGRLPSGTLLIEFALANGRLLIWTLRRGEGLRWAETRLEESEISAWVRRLATALQVGKGWEGPSTALYERLLRPVAGELTKAGALVLVPDGPLSAIPFAALRDARTGRLLVEDHPLSVAPSASFYLASLERERRRRRDGSTAALVLGDPAFSRELFPDLPRLPASAEEAHSIAHLFPGSRSLLGDQVTKAALLEAAGHYPLVHFAGHSILNKEHPLLSHLVLAPAPGGGDDGVLYARELLGRRLTATRLVVLASCRAAGGNTAPGETAPGLASAFLAAGVPAVIGSLWQVDDAMSRSFFARFYRILAEGADAVTALRAAQIQMLRDPRPSHHALRSWAGFELVGGVSPAGRGPK